MLNTYNTLTFLLHAHLLKEAKTLPACPRIGTQVVEAEESSHKKTINKLNLR